MSNPKSVQQLKLSGTYRPDRHGRRLDDQFPDDLPKTPQGLTAAERKLWKQIIDSYPAGVLTGVDWPALLMFVRWFSEWRAVDKQLAENPSNYRLAVLAAAASKQCMSAMQKLGLNPVDRCKLQADPSAADPEDDELLELIKKRA